MPPGCCLVRLAFLTFARSRVYIITWIARPSVPLSPHFSNLHLWPALLTASPDDNPVPVALPLEPALVLLAVSHRQLRPIAVELEHGDRGGVLGELPEPLFGRGVPDRDGRVAAAGGEGAVPEREEEMSKRDELRLGRAV